jgi:hypothetical protein
MREKGAIIRPSNSCTNLAEYFRLSSSKSNLKLREVIEKLSTTLGTTFSTKPKIRIFLLAVSFLNINLFNYLATAQFMLNQNYSDTPSAY